MYISTRKTNLAVILALVCVLSLCLSSTASYALHCEELRQDVLRLHVLANSDSEKDQQIKLLVRDRLLASGASCFQNAQNTQDALLAVSACKDQLTEVANTVLAENGADYTARIEIETEYFETRTYDDVTLPAGNYLAVRVLLGEAEGKNWWCVMFPPLCLPAVTKEVTDDFLDANGNVLAAEDGYEIRFRIVEWYESLRQKIKEHRT